MDEAADEQNNSAKRLLILMKKVLEKSDQISTVQVWAQVLGLDPAAALEDPHDVLEKLGLVRIEINRARTLMGETQFSPELYMPYLDRVRNVVTVANISAPWSNYKGNIQPDTLLALAYCSEILKPEPPISLAELQDVLDMLLKLRAEIETASYSPGVKDFLMRQLGIIEAGIRDYPISGVGSIKNAFRSGFTDMGSHSDPLEDPKDKEGYSKVIRAWQRFREGTKAFVETDKFAIALMNRIEQAKPLLGWLITPLS
ncbi:hypothetical protein C8R31_104100 [Nitrosospira sp. Nsp2]|uniref:hypothetical protein n=1 Tax=Nitrosospira sp. Nsp2 TaxID=136548 RepID=UPI000D30E225|nr:hypothetical protein [Nitrosospira sp. Nsp2]PTR15073.1 hypothetical protein C8R31_104100 [Nitrosospira sp. Nsp2]